MERASMTQLVNPSVSVIKVSVAVTVAFQIALLALMVRRAAAMVCAHPVHATALRGGAAMTVPLLSALVLAAVMVFARKVASVNANLGGMEMTAAKLVV